MGSGGQHGGETSSSPQRLFRHRRRPTTAGDADTGLDHPPSVFSPQGQPHSLRIRTPQYLSTLIHPSLANSEESVPAGTAPCGPILAFGRYVVSATNDGRVCFYSIKVDSDPILPELVAELDPHSALVGLVAAPAGVSLVRYRSTVCKEVLLKPPDLLGHVVAISSEGDVHLLECTTQKVKKLYSWNTGTCNTSCVTVRPDCNGQWRISLGYESGCLEEWQVSIPVRETKHDETEKVNNDEEEEETSRSNTTAQSVWKPLMRRVLPQLLYRGSFDMPIRSISSLGTMMTSQDEPKNNSIDESSSTAYGSNKNDTTISEFQVNSQADDASKETKLLSPEKGDNTNRSGGTVNETGNFLAVCLVMNPQTDDSSGRPASSSQVEVIHVARLERDWMLQERVAALPLEEYCIWPAMDILDTAFLPVNDSQGQRLLSRRIRGLPSRGSDCMCAHDGARPFFAAALSDGTIAVMHATFVDGSLRWGVDGDQRVLSFPAIGIAPVTLSTGPHVACCLRGSTVYLVPENDAPVTVILGPVEKQVSTQYLHGFHAGNVRVDGITSSRDNELPVLVYSGAGGILKVYSCELLSQTEQDCLLRELVENGSVKLLREMLCSLSEKDPLLIMDLWKFARDEFLQSDDAPTFDMLCFTSFANARRILIELAEEDYRNDGHD